MSDYFLRDLEREAEFSGVDSKCRFASALERSGDCGCALRVYGGILEDSKKDLTANYVVAQQGIINIGLPWVEFNPPDANGTVRFYNVMHKCFGGEARVSYVFTWDKELFRHPDRNQEIDGQDYFSQERLASILAREGMQKRPPTASAVHSQVLTLEEITRLNLQPEEAQRARDFLRQHLAEWPLTWTQIDCDKPAVIQDYDLREQRDNVDIMGANGYLRILNAGENRVGDLIKNSVLCAEQSVEEIDRMYNSLLEVSNGAYACRPGVAIGKRAVVLGRIGFNYGFNISCNYINDNGPACLVVTSSAKDFGGVYV